jgi:hypothetical protein
MLTEEDVWAGRRQPDAVVLGGGKRDGLGNLAANQHERIWFRRATLRIERSCRRASTTWWWPVAVTRQPQPQTWMWPRSSHGSSLKVASSKSQTWLPQPSA